MIENVRIDERTAQEIFYAKLAEAGFRGTIKTDLSTDGHSDYVLFEHKKNLSSFGKNKALGQALIYAARMNLRGIPVPGWIALVSQDEEKTYLYKTERFADIVNDTANAQKTASASIDSIAAATTEEDAMFASVEELATALNDRKYRTNFRVSIDERNVVNWADFFYRRAGEHKMKATKNNFFAQLKAPFGFMSDYIVASELTEQQLSPIMDLLNDPATQKQIGAFYTPAPYAAEALKLLRVQIADWQEKYPGDDYLIVDRCAGSGNLEMQMTEEELSHCIVNTYELKEWIALKNNIGYMVREIIPPIPAVGTPAADGQLLVGGDAMSEEFDAKLRESLKRNRTTEHCGIFFFENPPYGESGARKLQDSLAEDEKGKRAVWKDSYVLQQMRKAGVHGTALNDMANAFIWSAFTYMENIEDGYVVFSPIKYWKSQGLIDKKFCGGFLANREHFHASKAAISVMSWKNEDAENEELSLPAYNVTLNKIYFAKICIAKKIHSLQSIYYDKRQPENEGGILCDKRGIEYANNTSIRMKASDDEDIIGYLVNKSMSFENSGMDCKITTAGQFDGNGFYLREDNFMEKLPMFVSGWYNDIAEWYEVAFLNKTADGAEAFNRDVANGTLRDWLVKCMLWTCWTQHNHMRTLVGSDGRLYINKLALGQESLADEKLAEAIADGYVMSVKENELMAYWNMILDAAKDCEEYHEGWKYNLYQIDEEINIKVATGKTTKDGKPEMVQKYGDLNNMIKFFKSELKEYYKDELVDNLFKYEFIK